jgi:hypothetical protein
MVRYFSVIHGLSVSKIATKDMMGMAYAISSYHRSIIFSELPRTVFFDTPWVAQKVTIDDQ